MQLITKQISKQLLREIAKKGFGNLVKAVVDVDKNVMVIDASLHADEESLLLSHGSDQIHLWGINLYPDLDDNDFIEFDSMINVRPSQGNMTRSIDDPSIQKQIREIVHTLIL